MSKLLLFAIVSLAVASGKTLEEFAEPYFKSSEYQRMVQSPSGQYFAAETYYEAQEHIEIVDINKNKSYVVFNGTNGVDITISDIQWIDENSIIIQLKLLKSSSGDSIFKVIHLNYDGLVSVESSFEFRKRGYIIDNIPGVKNKVLFAHILDSEKNTSGAYKIDLTHKESTLLGMHFKNKIASKIRKPFYWLTDNNNKIRLILSEGEKTIHYWIIKENKWKKITSIKEDSDDFVYPLSINSNNQYIVIKRLKSNDRKGVYLLNPVTLAVEKQLFYSNFFDVTNVYTHPENSELIAVSYVKNGVINNVVMEKKLKDAQYLLKTKYPNLKEIYLSGNLDFSKFLFLVHDFKNEGIYVSVDLKMKKIKKLIEKAAWRKSLLKGRLEVINYKNEENLTIESYLSLPINETPKALLVMPHGGPIGVRSYGYFDSLSHFLASFGIAVLKINYRGSSGFGKQFEEAGKKQWGSKIEKDINDVVSYTLEKFKLKANKICSGGTSYGGYSALMLHINYPQRYRCIISVAGPTDLPLMFTSSDWNISQELIEEMTKIVGDPKQDIETLKNMSPLYNAKKINVPVLLIHGTDDFRVNIEHSIRLEFILNKLNKSVELLKIEGAKHGFYMLVNQIKHATELLKFINTSLQLKIGLPS